MNTNEFVINTSGAEIMFPCNRYIPNPEESDRV